MAGTKLYDVLEMSKKKLLDDFSDNAIDDIKTEGIARELRLFKKKTVLPLVESMDRVKTVIASPLHVGFLGRYSHGKTALVNSLFKLDDASSLPEGEGVVTSKVTYVSFQRSISSPCAYEVKEGGAAEQIDLEYLRSRVGKTDYDTSSVNYYKLDLPVDGDGNFASNFADKNINLVDMPGLGGAYFKDTGLTKRYLRELDVIIAVIKMDEIEQSGAVLNDLVDDYHGIPTLAVLTFSDMFAESKLYYDCDNDIDKALDKAKRMVKEYIPSLHYSNIIPVSSKENINIDALRRLILDTISSSDIAIDKARKEVSPVYRKRLAEFSKEYSGLKTALEDLSSELSRLLEPILPKNSDTDLDIVAEANDLPSVRRAKDSLLKEVGNSVKENHSLYKDAVESLKACNNEDDLKARLNGMTKRMNNEAARDTQERISHSFNSYCQYLRAEILNMIDSLSFDRKTKDSMSSGIRNVLDGPAINFDDCLSVPQDEDIWQEYYKQYAGKIAAGFFDTLVHDPSSLVMMGLGIACLCITILRTFFVFIGSGLIVLSVLSILIKQPLQKKRAFREAEEALIDELLGRYDVNERKETVKDVVEGYIKSLNYEIRNQLKKDQMLYNHDARMLTQARENIEETVESLSDKLEEELAELSSRR